MSSCKRPGNADLEVFDRISLARVGGCAPCGHERISEVGPEGSRGQTGTGPCTCGAALGKPRKQRCRAPTPWPCAGGDTDASTPVDYSTCACCKIFLWTIPATPPWPHTAIAAFVSRPSPCPWFPFLLSHRSLNRMLCGCWGKLLRFLPVSFM